MILNMKKLFLITGPCGVGKTTVSREIAKMVDNSAVIDGDILYHMINTDITPAEDSKYGANRLKVTFKNAMSLINNFLEKGINVIFEYIIFPEDFKYILKEIKLNKNINIKFVLLMSDEKDIIIRNKSRDKDNSNRGIELLKEFRKLEFENKYVLSTTNLKPEEVAQIILNNNDYIVNNMGGKSEE